MNTPHNELLFNTRINKCIRIVYLVSTLFLIFLDPTMFDSEGIDKQQCPVFIMF